MIINSSQQGRAEAAREAHNLEVGGSSPSPATILQLVAAIDEVKRAFGAPGDWGYGTAKGDALFALYTARTAAGEAVP